MEDSPSEQGKPRKSRADPPLGASRQFLLGIPLGLAVLRLQLLNPHQDLGLKPECLAGPEEKQAAGGSTNSILSTEMIEVSRKPVSRDNGVGSLLPKLGSLQGSYNPPATRSPLS